MQKGSYLLCIFPNNVSCYVCLCMYIHICILYINIHIQIIHNTTHYSEKYITNTKHCTNMYIGLHTLYYHGVT